MIAFPCILVMRITWDKWNEKKKMPLSCSQPDCGYATEAVAENMADMLELLRLHTMACYRIQANHAGDAKQVHEVGQHVVSEECGYGSLSLCRSWVAHHSPGRTHPFQRETAARLFWSCVKHLFIFLCGWFYNVLRFMYVSFKYVGCDRTRNYVAAWLLKGYVKQMNNIGLKVSFLGCPHLVGPPLEPGLSVSCLSPVSCRHLTWTHNISVPSWWNWTKLFGDFPWVFVH